MSDYGNEYSDGPYGGVPQQAENVDDILAAFDDLLAIQCGDGTWNFDPYMHGMANGMILMRSLVSGEDPYFLDAPDQWLADVELDCSPIADEDGNHVNPCDPVAEEQGFEDGLVIMATAAESQHASVRRCAVFVVRALQQPEYPDRLDEMSDGALAAEVDRLETALENAQTEQEADLILRLLDAAEDELDQRAL